MSPTSGLCNNSRTSLQILHQFWSSVPYIRSPCWGEPGGNVKNTGPRKWGPVGLGNQRRNNMWREHEKLQKRSRKLQMEDKLAQRRKTRANCPKRNGQARIEIEKLQTEMEDDGQKIKAETLNKAEPGLEIRALREGEGRRGSNGCCFDSSIVEQFIAMGTDRAKQQFAILRSELEKVDAESCRKRSNQPRQEQEKVGTRSRASQRTVYVGTQRQRGSQPRFSSWCCF